MVKQLCFNPFFPPFVCFPSVDVSLFHTKRALDIGRSIEALKLSQDPSERGRCHRDVSTEGWCQQGWGCCIVVVQFLLFSSANSAPKKETLSEDCEAFNTFYHIITHFNIIFILSSYVFRIFSLSALLLEVSWSVQDAKLSFKEFRSLMRCLREPRMARYSANLAFALFDLDGNHFVSRNEFRELYAFLLGHLPTLEDFEKEWDRLVQPNPLTSPGAAGEFADQRSYIRWLQSSENPVIRQQAPECQAHSAAPKATIPTSPTSSGSLGIGGIELTQTRPRWNQRFNCGVNPGHVNDSRPAGLREYFSRQQSMPELKRFWEAHYGSTFKRHLEADEIWWNLMKSDEQQTSNKHQQKSNNSGFVGIIWMDQYWINALWYVIF